MAKELPKVESNKARSFFLSLRNYLKEYVLVSPTGRAQAAIPKSIQRF